MPPLRRTPASDPRREARAAALQMLYALELNGQSREQVEGWYAERHPLPLAARRMAEELLRDAVEGWERARPLLTRHLRDWRTERLSVIDRCILRLAAAELLAERFVPAPVLLDEYVRLAKDYSQPQAVPLVHAVVDAMGRELKAAESAGKGRASEKV